jgi:lipopolysaccharide/colanic/teichoic acid biosynthesis glycosyltransferase
VGRGGKPFRMIKFRTMRAEPVKDASLLTVGEDPRITRIGRLVRNLKLDELPQLINVVRGEMSLVGPRPEVPKYVDKYTPEQRRVLDLMPGITDPASIRFRNESELLGKADDPESTYVERIMPEKIRLNLEYARRSSFLSDIGIVLKTLHVLSGGQEPC